MPEGDELDDIPDDILRKMKDFRRADHDYCTGEELDHECTAPDDPYPYVLVLERGEMSAFHYTSSQRIAGHNVNAITRLVREIVKRTRELHQQNLAHMVCELGSLRQ